MLRGSSATIAHKHSTRGEGGGARGGAPASVVPSGALRRRMYLLHNPTNDKERTL
jgi:hypothetical protein